MTSSDENPAISSPKPPASISSSCSPSAKLLPTRQSQPNHHTILLLSDSALPLGSFAFSSGLESHLAHTTTITTSSSLPPAGAPRTPPSTLLPHFLSLSLHSLCTTSLPHLLAAHAHPQHISEIDTIFDASTLCPVARRASIAQGRALLTLWERAFRDSGSRDFDDDDDEYDQQQRYNNNNGGDEETKKRNKYTDKEARDVLAKFSLALKKAFAAISSNTTTSTSTTTATNTKVDETGEAFFDQQQQQHQHLEAPNGHFAPLWGLVTRALQIPARDSVYVFLLNHAKSVVSAAVRASVMGPYQAQGLLGSVWLRRELESLVDRGLEKGEQQEEEEEEEQGKEGDGWRRRVEEAGQGVPAMDIWLGRHELLYSRIFNS